MLTRSLAKASLAALILPTLLTAQETAAPQKAAPNFTPVVEAPRLPVCSQGATGTCWSFATVSFLESEASRNTGKPVDLSEMFHVYQAYMDKTDNYVRLHGKAQFSQGGLCHDVFASLEKHGVMPASAFTGLTGDKKVHNHSKLAREAQGVAEEFAGKRGITAAEWQQAAQEVLEFHLGAVPSSFQYEGKNLTPKEFARDVLKLKAEDYISVMSYSYTPFGRRGELLVPDNWMRYQGYLNMPVNEMLAALDHALRNGFTCAVDMDVSEKGFSARNGLAVLPADLEDEKKITDDLRLKTFDDRTTTDDHLMHCVGIAKDENGKEWYMVKNSWGERAGIDGYQYISRPYMALKLLSFSVHRDGLPKQTQAQFGL